MHDKLNLLKNMIIKRFTGNFEEKKCILISQSSLDTLPGASQDGGSVPVMQTPAPPPAAQGVQSDLQSSCVSASGRFHV